MLRLIKSGEMSHEGPWTAAEVRKAARRATAMDAAQALMNEVRLSFSRGESPEGDWEAVAVELRKLHNRCAKAGWCEPLNYD